MHWLRQTCLTLSQSLGKRLPRSVLPPLDHGKCPHVVVNSSGKKISGFFAENNFLWHKETTRANRSIITTLLFVNSFQFAFIQLLTEGRTLKRCAELYETLTRRKKRSQGNPNFVTPILSDKVTPIEKGDILKYFVLLATSNVAQ